MLGLSVKLFGNDQKDYLLGDTKSLHDLVAILATMPTVNKEDIPNEENDLAFINGDIVTGKWVDQKFEGDEKVAFRKPGDTSPIYGARRPKIGSKKKKIIVKRK